MLKSKYFLAFMRDGARAFFIFNYFRAFKTEVHHIHSLIGQILKQLFPSVSVPSEKQPHESNQIFVKYSRH